MQFEDRRENYIKIATLYYLDNRSQDEIADIFHISRFKVSRILKKCRSLRIIEFQINKGPEYYSKLGQQIQDLLKLKNALIVPSGTTLQESKENATRVAAQYLQQTVKDGDKIGLSWGSTIQLTLRFFHPTSPLPNATFVQISGNLCCIPITEEGYMDGSFFVQQFASKAKAGWSVFQVPYVVQNPKLKEMLYQEPQIAKHIALFKELSIALIAVGSVHPERSVSFLSGYLTLDETRQLVKDGMGADLCGIRLTADGQIRETFLSNRVMTIDPETLHNVAEVCAVGAGSEKAHSFIAGCKGGFIKKVIMDEVCALEIIKQLEDE